MARERIPRESPRRVCSLAPVEMFQIIMLASEEPEMRMGLEWSWRHVSAVTKSVWPM